MDSSSSLSNNWEEKGIRILAILLGIFFLSKIFTLYTPLFHDEIGVYGRLLFYMMEHGPSMNPANVTPEFARGHPLFFTFFLSSLTSWFGGTYIVARAVILFLSLSLLVVTYILGRDIAGKKVGLLATIMLSFQPIFYAQSTMILPEIMLSLLAMLSLLFYIHKKYWLYFIFAGLLVLTKETGVILFAGVALNEWYKDKFRISIPLIGRVIKWSLPILSLFTFLAVQKYQYGWFLYPFHTSLISFNIGTILIRFVLNLSNLLLDQGRFMLTIAVLITLWKMDKEKRREFLDKNFLILSVCIIMLGFSSINYVMVRYLILILPLVMISIVSLLHHQGYTRKHLIIYFMLTLPFQFNFLMFRQDNDMGYLIVVESMKQSIAELDRVTQGDTVTVYAQFPELNALDFLHDGYTTNPNYELLTIYSDTIDYILISDLDYLWADKLINDMEYSIENKVDSILNDSIAYKNSNWELLYDHTIFYNRQRLYKTNNEN